MIICNYYNKTEENNKWFFDLSLVDSETLNIVTKLNRVVFDFEPTQIDLDEKTTQIINSLNIQ